MRVGYAELRVTPEVKRLAVEVAPAARGVPPGRHGAGALQVARRVAATASAARSRSGRWTKACSRSPATRRPIRSTCSTSRAASGCGSRATSSPSRRRCPKARRASASRAAAAAPDAADVLRSRFKTTAFFLGSVVTDAQGKAIATAKLPDNLTTFRVMAVAVTAGDRYGSGESPMLVTRPLVARPALPRFLRPGDRFAAGAVVNRGRARARR